MKLGVMNPVFGGYTFEAALKFLYVHGVHEMEIGAGGYPGKNHLDPEEMLGNPEKIQEFKDLMAKYEVSISAIACHGNALHPNKEIAARFDKEFKNAILMCEALGVKTIIGFAGCPGACEESKNPNWVTCPWPEDYSEILNWQWEEKVIPYWKETAAFAKAHGVEKIAFEMHPGFVVYNPETCLKLRAAVGDIIGANFDPSHLFWQGMDPVEAIKALQGAIYHFHAKDTKIDKHNTAVNGVLDTKSYSDILGRSWVFRTVGYGHGKEVWNEIISTLQAVGQDGAISIEHVDALMSPEEGLKKAIAFLKEVLITETAGEMWWA